MVKQLIASRVWHILAAQITKVVSPRTFYSSDWIYVQTKIIHYVIGALERESQRWKSENVRKSWWGTWKKQKQWDSRCDTACGITPNFSANDVTVLLPLICWATVKIEKRSIHCEYTPSSKKHTKRILWIGEWNFCKRCIWNSYSYQILIGNEWGIPYCILYCSEICRSFIELTCVNKDFQICCTWKLNIDNGLLRSCLIPLFQLRKLFATDRHSLHIKVQHILLGN